MRTYVFPDVVPRIPRSLPCPYLLRCVLRLKIESGTMVKQGSGKGARPTMAATSFRCLRRRYRWHSVTGMSFDPYGQVDRRRVQWSTRFIGQSKSRSDHGCSRGPALTTKPVQDRTQSHRRHFEIAIIGEDRALRLVDHG